MISFTDIRPPRETGTYIMISWSDTLQWVGTGGGREAQTRVPWKRHTAHQVVTNQKQKYLHHTQKYVFAWRNYHFNSSLKFQLKYSKLTEKCMTVYWITCRKSHMQGFLSMPELWIIGPRNGLSLMCIPWTDLTDTFKKLHFILDNCICDFSVNVLRLLQKNELNKAQNPD